MAKDRTGFRWGAASAAYQVEGGWQLDGKGLSNWDVWTNIDRVTEPVSGKFETGNVAINAYDRTQYLDDIALMKRLGLDCYRFSLAWSRLLPDGTGRVSAAGVAHYQRFCDELIAAGIEPIVTLFHWDLPQALQTEGGWHDRRSIDWFREYARVAREALGERVSKYITFNEPFIDLFLMEPMIAAIKEGGAVTEAMLGRQGIALHHWMVASAGVIADFRAAGFAGEIGLALPLMPMVPESGDTADTEAAERADAIINRWCLDAMFKGRYPDAVMEIFGRLDPDFCIDDADFALMAANHPDFLGVNFYAPAYIRSDAAAPFGYRWFDTNPDPEPQAFNGPVRPDALRALLERIRDDYGNPPIYITENGAGFGPGDEVMERGQIVDPLRADYLSRHIAAALEAKRDGVDLRGYMVWSLFDNFEWLFGYARRFGIVHVDFETQKRTPKLSFETYRAIITKGLAQAG
ncbi:family 1 glycosylhydrolase [Mesorhizobium sp. BR1-1-16]|uniref:glycoside hydrolase family 1 protein n=1 Tax=Mesorhizobium sp. BR1-1-16 TaxID=2876653 RepID=UPI001CC8F191|nr:family 1 glycosylhydrolase [Mesorhizobium sp. BR1-1-16]MBZ9938475.1 family 1 glycosylhydrolase [Mesorhizobium sp. BR1-1-16]